MPRKSLSNICLGASLGAACARLDASLKGILAESWLCGG
jgi:hypothetical protein